MHVVIVKVKVKVEVVVVVVVSFLKVTVEVNMKTLKLKNVAALVLATMITVPTFSQNITDGSIPCQDVANNEEAYGCSMEEANVVNLKYKCLKALSVFEIPLKGEVNNFSKPGKIQKGDKVVALGKDDGSIIFGDGLKDYKLPKDKIKQAIDRKFGDQAATKEDFKVAFQTPTGKIILKFKKKPLQDQSQSGYDIGKWEQIKENADSSSDDKAFVALGSEANQLAQSSEALNNVHQSMDNKITGFPSKVDQKVAELEQLFNEKEHQVDQNSELSSMDKVTMKRTIRAEKEEKKSVWLDKKRNMAQLRAQALRKCMGQAGIITENVLRGSASGAAPAGGIASTFGK